MEGKAGPVQSQLLFCTCCSETFADPLRTAIHHHRPSSSSPPSLKIFTSSHPWIHGRSIRPETATTTRTRSTGVYGHDNCSAPFSAPESRYWSLMPPNFQRVPPLARNQNSIRRYPVCSRSGLGRPTPVQKHQEGLPRAQHSVRKRRLLTTERDSKMS